MLTEAINPTEHWGNVDRIVSRWLKDRQELILIYCKVDGLKVFAQKDTPIQVRVHALCEVLIDYVSAGHFEVYQQLIKEAECFQDNYQATIDKLLPRIQESTEMALEFNDRYSDTELEQADMDRLSKHLNKLGMKMVERFELEDMLIDQLHTCHADKVA